MPSIGRREFLRRIASALPASAGLAPYSSLAAPMRKKVKVTDVKVMVVQGTTDWNLVKVETDGGLAGIGEAYWGHGVKDVILGYLRGLMIGEDPLDIDRLFTKMIRYTGGAGAIAGVTVTAISGVEIALWDLAGKILDAPVCKLLGGQYRDGVRVYWTRSPKDMLDPASCREFAAAIKSHPYGITAVKSDADSFPQKYDPEFREPGHEPGSRHLTRKDLSRIARGFSNLREALGEDIDIAVHCHWEFDWVDALELARAVAPIKPMWLEDVMPPEYSESWSKLTAESPVPILTGENLYRRQGFEPFILHQGCHLIQIDIPKAGGLLESKKIADLADLFYIPVCAHLAASPLGAVASAHCAAAIRDFRAQELSLGYRFSTDAWEKFVLYDGPIIKDGKVRILDQPGFGVRLNEDVVRAHLAPGEQWWG
ncbi:MAG TPA: mandelate racemase/muconate lactonizing enzyme family protein [Terriglobia bacterium]|nr:mandelate racemase/muconate lactonizing enzyme family protein [Terriglobia bacterium]